MNWWQTSIIIVAALMALRFVCKTLLFLKRRIIPADIKFTDVSQKRLARRIDFLRICGSTGSFLYIVDRESGRFIKFYKTVKIKGESFLTFAFPVTDWSMEFVDQVKAYLQANDMEIIIKPPKRKDMKMNVKELITTPCGDGWKLQSKIAQDVLAIMGYGSDDVFSGVIHGRTSQINRAIGW